MLAPRFTMLAAAARARADALLEESGHDTALARARLKRQAWAYHSGSLRLERISVSRAEWLCAYFDSRAAEPIVGVAYAHMRDDLRATLDVAPLSTRRDVLLDS